MADFDVLCVGAINFDLIATVDHVPVDDERMFAEAMVSATGGPAATAAVTLAKLGYRVAVSAAVGRDSAGDFVLDALQTAGVDIRYVTRHEAMTTSQSIILANQVSGHRTIITQQPNGLPDQFPLDAAPVIHVDQVGFGLIDPLLSDDSTRRPRLSIDAGNPIPTLDLSRTWLYTPTVAALTSRYGATPKESALAALREGAELVVATDGSAGSWWFAPETEPVHAPATKANIVSTLGAGDVFHGALLAALLDGQVPSDALRFANTCAALSCRAIDGQSAIPTRSEIRSHQELATATLNKENQ
ncbi:carbohydrate kinase family protein [Microbacterium sp. A84]|uniref:carbohydrate kinase family protein n=1 Tax=Microbacterium sp. A84 TaxID=3450715 RepID=UPI003F428221